MDLIPAALPGQQPPTAPRSSTRVTVLFVSPVDEDWECLLRIFQQTNWTLYRAKDYKEAFEMLRSLPIAVLVTEEQLPGGHTWLDMLTLNSPTGPTRIIVTTPFQNDVLWGQVLNLGGYDVLMKPFDSAEVIRVISLAWLSWRDQQREAEPRTPAAL